MQHLPRQLEVRRPKVLQAFWLTIFDSTGSQQRGPAVPFEAGILHTVQIDAMSRRDRDEARTGGREDELEEHD